jgi:septal ring factor EnvC (AmiA/AmiB activator)
VETNSLIFATGVVLSFCSFVYTYVKTKHDDNAVAAKDFAALSSRVAVLEANELHNPTKDQFSELSQQLSKTQAQTVSLAEKITSLERTIDRVTQAMIDRA